MVGVWEERPSTSLLTWPPRWPFLEGPRHRLPWPILPPTVVMPDVNPAPDRSSVAYFPETLPMLMVVAALASNAPLMLLARSVSCSLSSMLVLHPFAGGSPFCV